MKLKIGNIILENNLILAPMAGITNLAYRKMLKSFGFGLVVSEMISDFALYYENKETFKMLETEKEEHPLAIQIFGGSKETILRGVDVLLKNANFEILDVNLGCPVPKVVKENAGSSWLKPERQEELFDMMSTLVKQVNKPVTAKIRIGWDEQSINAVETAKILEKAGVTMIAVHGRTRSQFYSGSVNYDVIKAVKESVNIPVIANGDINSLDDAIRVLEYTKADGIMLGRGVLGNPYLATQIDTYLRTGERLPNATTKDQISYLENHFEELYRVKGEYKACAEMRGLSTHYLRGFPSCKQFKVRLSTMKSREEFFKILNDIKCETQNN